MIQVTNLTKTYQVARRNAGTKEAIRSFFSKKYDSITALDNISFTIPDGEMVGYIGPNGAGKSSTIKILSGILTPDNGQCVINGRVPYKDRVAHVRDIGVVFGQRSGLWWDVPVIDSFMLLKDIYKIPDNIYHDSLDELITLLNLSTIIQTPTRQLSLGQRMRAEVAASLLHRPRILFLDEPTIGLDAVSKIAVRNFIKEHNRAHKTTVILTTHDMQDIEAITNRIMLIGKGKLLLDGTVQDMKNLVGEKKKISIEYEDYKGFIDWSNFIDGVEMVSVHPETAGELVLLLDRSRASVSRVIGELEKYMKIKDLSSMDTSIDEVIVRLYEQYGI